MTKREFWLKYFNESDTALAFAIYLCEKFATIFELTLDDKDLIDRERAKLSEKMPPKCVEVVFGKLDKSKEKLPENDVAIEDTKKFVLSSANTVFVGDTTIIVPVFSEQKSDGDNLYSAKEAIAVLNKSIAEISGILNMIERQAMLYFTSWAEADSENYANELEHLSNAYFELFRREQFLERFFDSNPNETTYTKEELEAYKKELREVRKGLRRLYKRFRFFFGSDSGNVMRAIELKGAPLIKERLSQKEIELRNTLFGLIKDKDAIKQASKEI